MKTRNIFLTILALVALVFTQSCNQVLDVKPENQISWRDAVADSVSMEATLIGAYSLAFNGQGFATDLIMPVDLLSSDATAATNAAARYIRWSGTFSTYRDITNKAMVSTNGTATTTWTNAYRVINSCNLILANANSVLRSTSGRNRVRGEALFLRGAMYFELAKFYGRQFTVGTPTSDPAVPIVLQPVDPDGPTIAGSFRVPRATVAQVYTQVLSDLLAANNLLPASNSSSNGASGARANKGAATAWLARVYLMRGDLVNAALEADTAITSFGYGLMPGPLDVFRADGTREAIMEVQQNAQNTFTNGNNGLATFYLPPELGGRGLDVRISTGWVTANFPATDTRRAQFLVAASGNTYTNKWFPQNPSKNYVVCRLAEMYLIRAEARLATNPTQAQADLNALRTRAGLPALTVPPVLADVQAEKERELCFEGVRLFDRRRWGFNISPTIPANSDRLVYPIPQRERDAYSAAGFPVDVLLPQNTGY